MARTKGMKSMKSNMKTMKSMKAKKKSMKKTAKPKMPMVKWQNTEHKSHVGKFYAWQVAAAYFSPGSVCISWRGTKLHQFGAHGHEEHEKEAGAHGHEEHEKEAGRALSPACLQTCSNRIAF